MVTPILTTKLFIPPPRLEVIPRPRLIDRLNEGLPAGHRLTLVSAPAGFGKTTLLSDWISAPRRGPTGRSPGPLTGEPRFERPAAWLSLDEGDNDPTRFWVYLIAALQTIDAHIGEGVLGMLQSTQSPPVELILTTLLNEITALPGRFILVLDDYHVIETPSIDQAMTFMIEHLPPQMHLVIATREDPSLPLARLRARGQLTELRAADLRFTPAETTGFFNQAMGLALPAEDIDILETRTEGWIAGLQLAAISLQGQKDAARFIRSFSGSHHFVLDYLVQEVLQRQPENIQAFLLRTSILERLCGPLCDAVLSDPASLSGQETLEYLEQANLFIVPLDNERRWYRYHHLFAELLRQRLQQSLVSSTGDGTSLASYHTRASIWFEDNGLEIEAFQHAAAANDVERAERLIEARGMPLHFRGALGPILRWLESLPPDVLDTHPSLRMIHASVLLGTGQTSGIEEKLQDAERALPKTQPDDKTRDLIGRIASTRALLALSQQQAETIITQSLRALEYLHPDNHPFRTSAISNLGYAYQFQGKRAKAGQAYREALALSQASGNTITMIMASIGLGSMQEMDNQLYPAAQTYQSILQLAHDLPFPVISEAYLGLARIFYEWNDLEAAEQHWQRSVPLARQLQNTDRVVAGEMFLATLKLARGDAAGAAAVLAQAAQSVREHHFTIRAPEVTALQVRVLLQQGSLAAAAQLAQMYEIPASQARVFLAQGDTAAAGATLEPWRRLVEAKGWEDERLKGMILQALVFQAGGEMDRAVQLLGESLALAEAGGFIRLFVDEGPPMAHLLAESAARGVMPEYTAKLLAAFETERQPGRAGRQDEAGKSAVKFNPPPSQSLVEPLSQRELEVLRLIAQGLSNREIAGQLFIALSTVKGHSRIIFDKLQVQRRTEAVARARELDLLESGGPVLRPPHLDVPKA